MLFWLQVNVPSPSCAELVLSVNGVGSGLVYGRLTKATNSALMNSLVSRFRPSILRPPTLGRARTPTPTRRHRPTHGPHRPPLRTRPPRHPSRQNREPYRR